MSDMPQLVQTRTGFIYTPFFERFMETKEFKEWQEGNSSGILRITGCPYSGKVCAYSDLFMVLTLL
jgi:hypothetical protein